MLLDTLKKVLAVYGPTGKEENVADCVKKMLEGKVDSFRTDAMGNLIVEKKGKENGKTIMFSAHMDHIGLVVTDIEDEGYLRVTSVGGVSVSMSKTRHVVFANGVEGVVVCQPTKGETETLAHLFVDIGAEDKADALTQVQLGDVCVYAPDCFMLGEHRIASPAMDDRCAVALLVELLCQMEENENTVVGVFSTQEEVGLRGTTVAAY
ncbi:MAG: M42 family peptidase, partial [Clostridia bacterium]|nr:M42 family peptidase [Clostridia bacterium]